MIDFLRWCFESFWRWLGLVILVFWVVVAIRGTAEIIFSGDKKP